MPLSPGRSNRILLCQALTHMSSGSGAYAEGMWVRVLDSGRLVCRRASMSRVWADGPKS